MIKKTFEQFIKEAKRIHGDRYDYSLVDYKSNDTPIVLICKEHGEFKIRPVKHINRKQGCRICGFKSTAKKQSKTTEQFIKEAKRIHGDRYDYSLVDYKNLKNNIIILCSIHGKFEQSPNNHLVGKGCKYCGGTTKLNTIFFIEKAKEIHENNYIYSGSNYNLSRTLIKIICPIHGEFEQTPNAHLAGKGCNKCGFKFDKLESEIRDFISSLKISFELKERTILDGKELDILIPSHNLAIEFDGLYWHNELHKPSNYHLNKTLLCEAKGIQLIHIFEDEWLHKQDIVKSRLKNLLGLINNRIHGRKCKVREVSSKESRDFLDMNHLQGSVNSKIRFGLYYENELVSLMTLGGLRKPLGNINSKNTYELVRFCNKLNTSVIGGANKLLKYFIKTYSPKEIVSYADRRWSQGDLYDKLGFEFMYDTKPNYFYVRGQQRKYRFGFRKDILVKEGYDPTKSEHEIMLERKIYRIYDCGCKKYILNI